MDWPAGLELEVGWLLVAQALLTTAKSSRKGYMKENENNGRISIQSNDDGQLVRRRHGFAANRERLAIENGRQIKLTGDSFTGMMIDTTNCYQKRATQ